LLRRNAWWRGKIDPQTDPDHGGHVPITLLRWRKVFRDLPEVVALDDRRVRACRKGDEKAEALVVQEKRRLMRLEAHERRARRLGYATVAGVDEVGRGPLAGPLVAAAVVFEKQPWIPMLDDSKKLSEEERESIFELILGRARAVGIGTITVDELNVSNLHVASLEAMRRALSQLGVAPDFVLVDGCHRVPGLACEQATLIKGDALSISVAAASVVAKVTRDRHMDEMDRLYPDFGFRANKGYATAEHRAALRAVGPSPIHRRLFAPVAEALDNGQLMLWEDTSP
jgi:ribonuclease HII